MLGTPATSTDTKDKPNKIASIEFTNEEKYPVFVKAAANQIQQGFSFSPVLIDGGSTQRVYIQFPDSLTEFVLKAYNLQNVLLINGGYSLRVTPGNDDQIIRARIYAKGTYSIILLNS